MNVVLFAALTYPGTIPCRACVGAASQEAAQRYLEAYLSLSLWLEVRGVAQRALLDRIEVRVWVNFNSSACTSKIQRNFSLFNMRNTISEAADFNEGAVCSTIHMYTSLVLYILNHSKGESRPCIRSGHSAG